MTGVSESARDRLRADRMGYVFQTFNLLHGYSALENVELGMMFGPGVDARYARELLERVGLGHRLTYRPRQLSVGQQQRVAVARALANRPKLVLADEPTGNLDRRHALEALDLMREVCREHGAALLLVSHDPEILAHFERTDDLSLLNRASLAHAPSSPGAR
jgi:ABC-type lipoprotein export system ATPase subunit